MYILELLRKQGPQKLYSLNSIKVLPKPPKTRKCAMKPCDVIKRETNRVTKRIATPKVLDFNRNTRLT